MSAIIKPIGKRDRDFSIQSRSLPLVLRVSSHYSSRKLAGL